MVLEIGAQSRVVLQSRYSTPIAMGRRVPAKMLPVRQVRLVLSVGQGGGARLQWKDSAALENLLCG